jgi:pentapeptide MXKDX repeat protein
MKSLEAIAVAAILATVSFAFAADTTPGEPMRMDEPMHGEMKKESMKKGDVKKAAEKKRREMKPMMEKDAAGPPKK